VGVEGMRQWEELKSYALISAGGAPCHMMVVLVTGNGCDHNGNFYTFFNSRITSLLLTATY
jgi:hypothetical protein